MRPLHRLPAILLCFIAAGCAPDAATEPAASAPALARAASGSALRSTSQVLQWSGTALRDRPPTGAVPECAAVSCDRFDLTVDLPASVWQARSGGVQVALRWNGFGNNLKLYVYRGATRVAASDGILATAQSTLIPNAANGAYQVYVAYDDQTPLQFGLPVAERLDYEALAEVEYPPKEQPRRALLPDLESRPQRNVTFDVPPGVFFEAGVPTTSCFPSEIAEEGARLCLRFDQVLANSGEGPLEFRFLLPPDPMASPTGSIVQRVYNSDGSATERAGGTWEFHPTHEHFHYTGFALSRLWSVDALLRKLSETPARSRRHRVGTPAAPASLGALPTPASTGRKVSFCIVDIEIDAWARKGDAPRTYSAPACLMPTAEGALRQGLSAGWSDVYDWFLPDQFLEASGLADGLYVLETVADPDDTILEANESNNCGAVLVRLSGMAGATPRAQVVSPLPGCLR